MKLPEMFHGADDVECVLWWLYDRVKYPRPVVNPGVKEVEMESKVEVEGVKGPVFTHIETPGLFIRKIFDET